jgi:hypothetical protein
MNFPMPSVGTIKYNSIIYDANKKPSARDQGQIKQYVAMQTIEATTSLLNGSTLMGKRERGVFCWYIDGVGVSPMQAEQAMTSELSRDVWVFTAADGDTFEMRRPNQAEKVAKERKEEIEAWNAAVEAKKVMKRY